MGLQIINSSADYSAPGKNLGNINKSFNYVALGVATAFQGPLKQLYSALKDASLLPLIKTLYINLGGGADAYNLINPKTGPSAFQLDYFNDLPSAHTSTGWQLDNNRWADTHLTFEGGEIGLFCFNTTPENSGANSNSGAILLGVQTSNVNVFLARSYSGNTAFNYVESGYTPLVDPGAPNLNGVGFLGGVVYNGKKYLYNNGVLLNSVNSNLLLPADNSLAFGLGGLRNGAGVAVIKSSVKAGMFIITSGLTPQNVTDLNSAVQTFATAVGW